MRYVIYSEDKVDYQIGLILKSEIERFDIRSSVSLDRYPIKRISKEVDVVISIGVSLLNNRVPSSIPQYFLHQSYRDGKKEIKSSESIKVIADFGKNTIGEEFGSPLFDLFRSLTIKHNNFNDTPYVLIMPDAEFNRKKLTRLEEVFKEDIKNHDTNLCGIYDVMQNPHIIKEASSAVVSCPLGEMIALHFNVPYIRLIRKSLFGKRERSILNVAANKQIVKELFLKDRKGLLDEILNYLNDHQYCASLMNEFQRIKDTISKPIIRNIARDIVKSLES